MHKFSSKNETKFSKKRDNPLIKFRTWPQNYNPIKKIFEKRKLHQR